MGANPGELGWLGPEGRGRGFPKTESGKGRGADKGEGDRRRGPAPVAPASSVKAEVRDVVAEEAGRGAGEE